MTAKSKENATPQTRKKTATVSYPYHPLNLCFEMAKAVAEIGNGKQPVSKSLLASHMKADEQATDFLQKITSSKCYGLIGGRGDFTLTDISRALFFPTEDPERQKKVALLEAVKNPGAFSALLDRYDGSKLPALELIGNVISQHMGIAESWKMRVAAFFTRSLEYAGAVSAEGHLRYKAEVEKVRNGHSFVSPPPTNHQDSPPAVRQELPPSPPVRDVIPNKEGLEVWTYRVNGEPFRIEYPENMTRETWEKINRFLHALEPT